MAYKIQLHGIEWIVSLSADWDQSPTTTTKKKGINNNDNIGKAHVIDENKAVTK